MSGYSKGNVGYGGQIVGIHNRGNDLTVNPLKAKQLTNIRTVIKDDNVLLAARPRNNRPEAVHLDSVLRVSVGIARARLQ